MATLGPAQDEKNLSRMTHAVKLRFFTLPIDDRRLNNPLLGYARLLLYYVNTPKGTSRYIVMVAP